MSYGLDPRRARWRDLRPGLACLAALAVAATTIFFIDVLQRNLAEGPALVVAATEARGLTPGADVWIAGVRAGRVVAIHFADPGGREERRVVVDAVLFHRAAPALRADAEPRIAASALLAPVVLTVDPGSISAPAWRPGDTLQAAATVTPEAFMARVTAAHAALDTLAVVEQLGERLRDGPGTLAALSRDESLTARLAASVRRASALSADGGSVSGLLDDEELRAAGRRSIERLAALGEEADETAETLADLAPALERLRSRLTRLGERLAAGGGTAGRALNDAEIRLQLEGLRAAVDSARTEIGTRPLRWLRVRPF